MALPVSVLQKCHHSSPSEAGFTQELETQKAALQLPTNEDSESQPHLGPCPALPGVETATSLLPRPPISGKMPLVAQLGDLWERCVSQITGHRHISIISGKQSTEKAAVTDEAAS